MTRIASALLVTGCLLVGSSSALAAPPAPAPPVTNIVCTMGSTSVSVASLLQAGFKQRPAERIMSQIIAMAKRFPRWGVTCAAPKPPVMVS